MDEDARALDVAQKIVAESLAVGAPRSGGNIGQHHSGVIVQARDTEIGSSVVNG